MSSNSHQFVSVRETAQILAVSEKQVMDLIEQRKLQAYRIADKFLRLKKTEVLNLRNAGEVSGSNQPIEYTSDERLKDFIYFNDFYIIATLIVAILFYIIFYT